MWFSDLGSSGPCELLGVGLWEPTGKDAFAEKSENKQSGRSRHGLTTQRQDLSLAGIFGMGSCRGGVGRERRSWSEGHGRGCWRWGLELFENMVKLWTSALKFVKIVRGSVSIVLSAEMKLPERMKFIGKYLR